MKEETTENKQYGLHEIQNVLLELTSYCQEKQVTGGRFAIWYDSGYGTFASCVEMEIFNDPPRTGIKPISVHLSINDRLCDTLRKIEDGLKEALQRNG